VIFSRRKNDIRRFISFQNSLDFGRVQMRKRLMIFSQVCSFEHGSHCLCPANGSETVEVVKTATPGDRLWKSKSLRRSDHRRLQWRKLEIFHWWTASRARSCRCDVCCDERYYPDVTVESGSWRRRHRAPYRAQSPHYSRHPARHVPDPGRRRVEGLRR
jgi:hypothetical protein